MKIKPTIHSLHVNVCVCIQFTAFVLVSTNEIILIHEKWTDEDHQHSFITILNNKQKDVWPNLRKIYLENPQQQL